MINLIPTPQNTKTITDMRENALELLKQVKKQGPTYIFHRSKPEAVVLSVNEFKQISQRINDLQEELLAQKLENETENKNDYLSEKEALEILGLQ